MDKAPKVSIRLPVYDGEELMPAAMESISRQTYTNFEVVISDSASSDRMQAIGREFEKRDPRVRYVRNERNLAVARNFQSRV
ncbi:MAG: glycosyltransferase family 2 protein [Burkholderiales bacterium]